MWEMRISGACGETCGGGCRAPGGMELASQAEPPTSELWDPKQLPPSVSPTSILQSQHLFVQGKQAGCRLVFTGCSQWRALPQKGDTEAKSQ